MKKGYKLNLTDDARKRIGWRKGKIFTQITKICEVCKKEFVTVPSSSKQFCCSRKCQSIKKKKEIQKSICNFCGELYISKAHKKHTSFCSKKCASKFRWDNHIKKIRPSQVLLRNIMQECQICGYKKIPQILERHHIDFDHSNNTINNLQVLCPNCHDEIHFLAKNGVKYRQIA